MAVRTKVDLRQPKSLLGKAIALLKLATASLATDLTKPFMINRLDRYQAIRPPRKININ